jgi:hypothetical protein
MKLVLLDIFESVITSAWIPSSSDWMLPLGRLMSIDWSV